MDLDIDMDHICVRWGKAHAKQGFTDDFGELVHLSGVKDSVRASLL